MSPPEQDDRTEAERAREKATADLRTSAVKAFESLTDLEFTDAQRATVAESVEQLRERLQALRQLHIGYDIAPPLTFSPRRTDSGIEPTCPPFQLSPGPPPTRPADDDLAFLPLPTLARLLETRQLSPVELTRLYLERCNRYGPALHCIVTPTADLAMEQARQAETEILRGDYRGPLHGMPWGAKDLLATRGLPTTWGATPFADQVIDADAAVIERLRQAGAVLVAKLSLGALAAGPHWFGGMTRNPWKPDEGSSGSSAGPAAATAAGLVGFSIGSETCGSIVSPSHICGVVGLRPTYGRVSRYGAMALSWTMDKLGPMCRGVEDCAAVFAAIHGADARDPSTVDRPFNWQSQPDLKGIKIGWMSAACARTDPSDQKLYADARDVLSCLGAEIGEATLPDYPNDALGIILRVEAATVFDELTRSGDLDILTEKDKSNWPRSFRAARLVPAVEYLRAQPARTLHMDAMQEKMAPWDLLAGPAMDGPTMDQTNLTGHPALALPCGFVEGAPRGIGLIGHLDNEARLLAVGHAYEQATQWHRRHPDLNTLSE